jgi:hypothetical protein
MYMLRQILGKVNPDGSDIFTATQSDAAEHKPGTVLCFMHKDSPEREILSEIGLTANPCPKSNLRNNHSKRMHAKHRHRQEWEAYEEYLDDQKEEAAVDRQERQLNATLELARGAVKEETATCDICGKTGLKNVGSHKQIHKAE